MKWQSHKICNIAIIYGLTGNLKATIFATIGAILPDVMELNGIIKHRTITHFPWFYVVAIILLIPTMHLNYYVTLGFWTIIGCLLHLTMDAMSKSGIPYRTPYGNKKIALNLYTTHHITEIYIVGLVAILFFVIARINNYTTNDHFTNQIALLISGQ